MACIELDAKIQKMKQNLKEQEKVALQASMQFEDCKKRTERSKQQLAVAKRHAESIAIITPALSEEFKEVLWRGAKVNCTFGFPHLPCGNGVKDWQCKVYGEGGAEERQNELRMFVDVFIGTDATIPMFAALDEDNHV